MSKSKKEKNKDKDEDKDLDKETFKKGVSIILRKLKPYKRIVFIVLILSFLSGLFTAAVPYLAGKIFDGIVEIASGSSVGFRSVFIAIAVWFVIKAVGDISDWYVNFHTNKLSTNTMIDYRSEGFPSFLRFPLSFFSNKSPSESLNKVNIASIRLGSVSTDLTIGLLPQFLSIIAALFITFFIHYQLALLLVGALVIYLVILIYNVPKLSELRKKFFKNSIKGYRQGYDAVDNIQEVKQAGTEEYERKRISGFFRKSEGFDIDWLKIFTKLNLAQKIIIGLTQLAIFSFSVFLVSRGEITPGELVAFNGYSAMLFGPFIVLGRNWQRIQSSFVEIVDAEDILSTKEENYEPEDYIAADDIKGKVDFDNVHFSYPKDKEDKNKKENKEVLKGITFSVEPGDDIALVGESGVGKSTLIKLILGFYFPTKGKIKIDDKNIKKFKLNDYRSKIGVVPQEPVLFNDTVLENIRYGKFDASEKEVEKAAKKAHAHEFIQDFPDKYDQLVGWRGIKLSSGQKQRIALARAFLSNPSLLILDEPTSALDAESETFIQESIKDLMKGRTTFIIAHRLSTVREADKIIVLDDGKIAETGSHKELMKNKDGIYQKLYEMQTSFY